MRTHLNAHASRLPTGACETSAGLDDLAWGIAIRYQPVSWYAPPYQSECPGRVNRIDIQFRASGTKVGTAGASWYEGDESTRTSREPTRTLRAKPIYRFNLLFLLCHSFSRRSNVLRAAFCTNISFALSRVGHESPSHSGTFAPRLPRFVISV